MSFDGKHAERLNRPGRRSGNTRRFVIVGLALITLLLAVAGVWFASRPDVLADAEVEAVRFLDRIRNGDVDVAWEETTAEFKSFIGRDRLRRTVESTPVLQHSCELVSCQPTEVGPLKLIECLFRSDDFSDVIVRVLLGPEQGQWRVERLEIQSAG